MLSSGREFILTRGVIGCSELRAFGMAIISIGTCVVSHRLVVNLMDTCFKSSQHKINSLCYSELLFLIFIIFFSTAEHSVIHDELSGSSAVKLLYFLY